MTDGEMRDRAAVIPATAGSQRGKHAREADILTCTSLKRSTRRERRVTLTAAPQKAPRGGPSQ